MFLFWIIFISLLQGCSGKRVELFYSANTINSKEFDKLQCTPGMVLNIDSIICPRINRHNCHSNELLAKFQRLLNFKTKPILTDDFHIVGFDNATSSISLEYECVSIPVCLSIDCKTGAKTCLPSTAQRQCQCIDVPDRNNGNKTMCSGATYKGCFNISNTKSDLTVNLTLHLTPDLCIRMCQLQGFLFAWVSGSEGQCRCHKGMLDQGVVVDDKCLNSCHSKTSASCGQYPFAHVYDTGISSTAPGIIRCSDRPCLKSTTRCLDTYNSYVCVCDERANQKYPYCAGCLENWFSGNVVNKCYSVNKDAVTMSPMSAISTASCSRIYGQAMTIQSINEAVFAIRILTDYFIRKGITGHFQQMTINEILKSVTSQNLHQYPICERPKVSTFGRYPWASWPAGSFGLPGANTGCPLSVDVPWIETEYLQDTEDENNSNGVSINNHFKATINNDTITRSFCMKPDYRTHHGKWPKGNYCIYKKIKCPPDFEDGLIFWDDEDINNNNTKFSDPLPDGMFKEDTKIEYCCRHDPGPLLPMILPRDKPFYLFPVKGTVCTSVSGTVSSLEYIIFDIENTDGSYSANVAFEGFHPYAEIMEKQTLLKLYFCYYKPVQWCGFPRVRDHASIIGNMNFSVGATLQYECFKGYENIGDSEDTCLPNEQWASLDGPICVDIDECENSDACHVKANCYNEPGSFACICNPGWEGDGKSCKVISCPPPLIPIDGFIRNYSDSIDTYLPNKHMAYGCKNNFLLLGYNATTCRVNGQWDPPPICKDHLLCTPNTYTCEVDALYTASSSDSAIVANCSCVIRNYTTRPPYNDDADKKRLRRLEELRLIIITACCSAVIILAIVSAYFMLRKKRKRRRTLRHLVPVNSIPNGIKCDAASGVYAEIHEIHCGVEMATKYPVSNKVSNCSSLSTEPPNPPPRQSSTISCDSNFDNATSMTSVFSSEFGSLSFLRRHTVFTDGESLLSTTPTLSRNGLNKQLSFQGDKTSSFAFDPIPTRFKLTSHERLANRRGSEFANCSSNPQSPLCFSGRKGRRRSSLQSLTTSETAPRSPDILEEKDDIFCIPENPYLDLVEYETRLKRESIKAMLLEKNTDVLQKKHRAYSQKVKAISKIRVPIRRSLSAPNIYIIDKQPAEDNTLSNKVKQETHNNSEGRITFQFHLSADLIHKSRGNPPDNEYSSEMYSRLKRYNMNVCRSTDVGDGFRRMRSDTNPI